MLLPGAYWQSLAYSSLPLSYMYSVSFDQSSSVELRQGHLSTLLLIHCLLCHVAKFICTLMCMSPILITIALYTWLDPPLMLQFFSSSSLNSSSLPHLEKQSYHSDQTCLSIVQLGAISIMGKIMSWCRLINMVGLAMQRARGCQDWFQSFSHLWNWCFGI